MHGSFITQQNQLKVLKKVKTILSEVEAPEKEFILSVVDQCIQKIEHPEAEKKAKKPMPALGKKRAYAEKLESGEGEKTVIIEPAAARN